MLLLLLFIFVLLSLKNIGSPMNHHKPNIEDYGRFIAGLLLKNVEERIPILHAARAKGRTLRVAALAAWQLSFSVGFGEGHMIKAETLGMCPKFWCREGAQRKLCYTSGLMWLIVHLGALSRV